MEIINLLALSILLLPCLPISVEMNENVYKLGANSKKRLFGKKSNGFDYDCDDDKNIYIKIEEKTFGINCFREQKR